YSGVWVRPEETDSASWGLTAGGWKRPSSRPRKLVTRGFVNGFCGQLEPRKAPKLLHCCPRCAGRRQLSGGGKNKQAQRLAPLRKPLLPEWSWPRWVVQWRTTISGGP